MNLQKKNNNMNGFTLIEIMIVIAIIAVLATLAAPKFQGYLSTAQAQAISSTVTTVDNEIKQLAKTHRISNCASATSLTAASNTYLDVLYNGSSMVLAAKRNAYDRKPHANYNKLFAEITAAVSGSSAGVYAIKTMPFAIGTCTSSENIYTVQNVNTDVLEGLLEEEYPTLAAAFAPATAVTTGPVRYTAASSNDDHTVTFAVAR